MAEDNVSASGTVVYVLGLGSGDLETILGVLGPDDAVGVAPDGECLEEEVVVLETGVSVRSFAPRKGRTYCSVGRSEETGFLWQ
jgi:hypothetical protein